jgi:hypothetical protein
LKENSSILAPNKQCTYLKLQKNKWRVANSSKVAFSKVLYVLKPTT